MYYSNEHIKDLSTYKTPPPALVRPTVRLFPLSPQFCCEKVMKHWRSSVILLNLKPHGILGPQVSLKCPWSVLLSGQTRSLITAFLLISPHLNIDSESIDELPPIYPDHHYLLEHLKDSKPKKTWFPVWKNLHLCT